MRNRRVFHHARTALHAATNTKNPNCVTFGPIVSADSPEFNTTGRTNSHIPIAEMTIGITNSVRSYEAKRPTGDNSTAS